MKNKQKYNERKYNVTIEMIAVMTQKGALALLEDANSVFTSLSHMEHCAEKAKVELRDYYEVYGTAPLHRYCLADFETQLLDGDISRVSYVHPFKQKDNPKLIDVSEGRLAKATREGLDKLAHSEDSGNEETEVDKYVSGAHYNDVVPGMQYMEMMQHMLAGKSGVEAHLFGQVYKYLMRAGKKDDYEQDIRKARWYTNCLTKYVQTGEIDVYNNDQ